MKNAEQGIEGNAIREIRGAWVIGHAPGYMSYLTDKSSWAP
jgi:hypothetical protein